MAFTASTNATDVTAKEAFTENFTTNVTALKKYNYKKTETPAITLTASTFTIGVTTRETDNKIKTYKNYTFIHASIAKSKALRINKNTGTRFIADPLKELRQSVGLSIKEPVSFYDDGLQVIKENLRGKIEW